MTPPGPTDAREHSRRSFLAILGGAALGLAACGSPTPARTAAERAQSLKGLKLVNWYPHDAAWSHLWTDASEAEISRDFAAIATLGANAVRVIIGAYAFGYPLPRPAAQAKLQWIVQAAHHHGLQVQLTLFDFWQDYADVSGSRAWMQKVVGPYTDDTHLCFLELKNEVDPSDQELLNWLTALFPTAKAVAGSIPITASVTSAIGLPEIDRWVAWVKAGTGIDLLSIHWYGDAREATSSIAAMRTACGSTPLFIGETGLTAAPVGSQSTAQAESNQAAYLKASIAACRAAGLALPAPWVWQDFTAAALPFVGQETSQLHYGLLRLDGSKRPAYKVIEQAFT